jgi:hypothetical protein
MQHRAKRLILIALIAAFLVPYGWLAQQSPVLDRLFNQAFHTLAAHIVGHAMIFAIVGLAALRALPGLRGRPASYAALILAVALGQEGFQMLYKGLYLYDTLGDIMVDLLAAAGALALAHAVARRGAADRHLKGARQP